MVTKFQNGTVSNVTLGTALKMFAGRAANTALRLAQQWLEQ